MLCVSRLLPQDTRLRGLGFKFVDFLHKSSDICNIEIKIISSENTILYLSYEILNTLLLNMDEAQHYIKHNEPPSIGARRGNVDVEISSNFNKYRH